MLCTTAGAISLAACSSGDGDATQQDAPSPGSSSDPAEDAAASTRPSGEVRLVTVEGHIEAGVECPVLRTPDGKVYALSLGEADFGPGDYVRYSGELADASFCQQGEGTLIARNVSEIDPPARDRDPARAGGIALTRDYLTGSWVAKGVDADCRQPDFRIEASPAGIALKGRISDHDDTARVVLGDYPRIDLDEPLDDLPIESRGPDGLAILRPANDAQYDPVTIGDAAITGDGVVFVKCA
ncbi:DUF5818 domain-containing protein [Qipengyuania sp. JC766]|uniref:DUF5818 domain-containing protein n=1 Tax=Qipengyuania sp. JC766 TaxID=3232139 RepID=UPI003457D6A2